MVNQRHDYDGIRAIYFVRCKLKSILSNQDISSMIHKLVEVLGLKAGRTEPMFYEYGQDEHLGILAVMPLVESHMLFQVSADVGILEIEIAHTSELQISGINKVVLQHDKISRIDGVWLHKM